MVDYNTAKKDIERWLDAKKVRQSVRQAQVDAINELIECVQEGILVVQDNGTIEHTLLFPIESEEGTIIKDKLMYKPRVRMDEIQSCTKNVKAGDIQAMVNAYLRAVTGEVSATLLGKLDTQDAHIAQNIVAFFM